MKSLSANRNNFVDIFVEEVERCCPGLLFLEVAKTSELPWARPQPIPGVPLWVLILSKNSMISLSISSLLQRRIKLDDIIVNINQSGTAGTKSYTFTRNVASSTGEIEFDASFPIRPDHIEKIDLHINILEDEKQRLSFPPSIFIRRRL
jgi:hypothetical protein